MWKSTDYMVAARTFSSAAPIPLVFRLSALGREDFSAIQKPFDFLEYFSQILKKVPVFRDFLQIKTMFSVFFRFTLHPLLFLHFYSAFVCFSSDYAYFYSPKHPKNVENPPKTDTCGQKQVLII